MQSNVLNDLAKAKRRRTEKKKKGPFFGPQSIRKSRRTLNLLRGPAEPSHSHPLISLSPLFQLSAAGTPGLSPLSLFLLLYTKKTMKSQVCTTRWQKVLPFPSGRSSALAQDTPVLAKSWGPALDPCAKETCFKKGSESGPPWNHKRSPLEGPVLAPSLQQICWSVYFKLKLIWPATAASGNLNWGGHFCAPAFSYVLRTKKGSLLCSNCFASISIGLRPSRPPSKPASKLALRGFVLISMVSRHWSSRLALRPAFNFVSSYKIFVLLQFRSTWTLEACLEAVPLRQLRPKILARQHSCRLLQVQPCWDFNNSII